MATLTRSVTVDAPVEKVFDYALDFRNLWGTGWPGVGLADVEIKPEGVGTKATFFEHVLGLHVEMHLEYIEVIRPERIVAKVTSPGLDRPTWTFLFHPVEEGTSFTVRGEWHINVPAVGNRVEDFMVRSHGDFVEMMLGNVKAGVEGTTA